MKKVVFILILGVFLWSSICLGKMASVGKNKVNVRSGPGTNYEVLWQVHNDYPVKILEKKGDWVKTVDYEKDIGWIHRSLLSEVQTVIVIKDKVNIRGGPGTNHKAIFQAENDVIFQLVDRKENWLKVRYEDRVGWIRKDLVWGE